ncbi:hypothetical protein NXX42_01895 [Bacteroides thetaiotaomicron]|nr:hypothetical protein [Bacteroides thetaiotaomicron]
MYEYAYNTSRAIPLRTASNELYFYANEAGRNGVLSYNIMNELNHTGNKNDNSAIDVAVNLDWEGCFMDEIFIYIRTVQKQRDTRKLG